MNSNQPTSRNPGARKARPRLKLIGVGGGGGNAVDHFARESGDELECVCLNTDARALEQLACARGVPLGQSVTRGLGTGGDPELGHAAAETDLGRLRELCSDVDVVFIVAGLGGGTGTGASPTVARVAREAGALVLGVVTLPFDFEGTRRQRQAQWGLQQLKRAADGVVVLPNQKVFHLIDENTSVLDGFKMTNELLGQAVHGVRRLLTQPGIINVDFADVCTVLRGRHAESCFASVTAQGDGREREIVDLLFSSPLLDGDRDLAETDAILVSLVGGPDLTLTMVRRVMDQIKRRCGNAHLIVGAAIDPALIHRLTVTLISSRRGFFEPTRSGGADPDTDGEEVEPDFDTQFFKEPTEARSASRYVAPPPELPPEKTVDFVARHGSRKLRRAAKKGSLWRQETLPLQIVSRGRFEKSEPTIHRGEDLDVPTYVRRGIALN